MTERKKYLGYVKFLFFIIAVFGVVLLVDFLTGGYIKNFGIYPRSIRGLPGIFLSPFIHLNMSHLVANVSAFFVLGFVLMYLMGNKSYEIFFLLIIMSGLGTWLFGRGGTVHIGASGVIYGLMGYLLLFGIFSKNLKAIIVSIILFFLYGGAVWGVLPGRAAISWEGHLSGFISGIILAKFSSKLKIN